MKGFSIIAPTYNEAENIKQFIGDIDDVCRRHGLDYEIVVVDDNSPDGTYNQALKLSEKYVRVKPHIRRGERGLASSIRYGIEKSTYQNLLLLDTDLSHDCELIPRLVERLSTCDISVGSRFTKDGAMKASHVRVVGSMLMNLFIRVALGMGVKDSTGGFIAIKKSVVDSLDKDAIFKGYGDYCISLLYLAKQKGYSICETGYTYRFRSRGMSKTSFFTQAVKYLLLTIRLRLG